MKDTIEVTITSPYTSFKVLDFMTRIHYRLPSTSFSRNSLNKSYQVPVGSLFIGVIDPICELHALCASPFSNMCVLYVHKIFKKFDTYQSRERDSNSEYVVFNRLAFLASTYGVVESWDSFSILNAFFFFPVSSVLLRILFKRRMERE